MICSISESRIPVEIIEGYDELRIVENQSYTVSEDHLLPAKRDHRPDDVFFDFKVISPIGKFP